MKRYRGVHLTVRHAMRVRPDAEGTNGPARLLSLQMLERDSYGNADVGWVITHPHNAVADTCSFVMISAARCSHVGS